ncbi:hypothetical protein B566_EDAN010040 [Ephemera danica]|nr:hypothetical protein B566_EDAN010040 [Ephemera danica]
MAENLQRQPAIGNLLDLDPLAVAPPVQQPRALADALQPRAFGLLPAAPQPSLPRHQPALLQMMLPSNLHRASRASLAGDTCAHPLLDEFPELTRPSGVPHEVKHSTVPHPHHSRTNSRPRRLDPDRLIRHAQQRHCASLRAPMVFSSPFNPQEEQRLAPVR